MKQTSYMTYIPRELEYDSRLTDFDIRLIGYIYTLELTTGTAFPSNAELAQRFRKSRQTIKNSLGRFYAWHIISSELVYDESGKGIAKRILSTHFENLESYDSRLSTPASEMSQNASFRLNKSEKGDD